MSDYPCRGRLHPAEGGAWVADNATLTGEVTLGEDVSVKYRREP